MAATIIQWVFTCIGAYLICGFLFSLVFISKGLRTLDEGSHGAGIGFKLIIIPGCMVFWPLLLKKWRKAKKEMTVGMEKE
jgi:hypothetical protein